MVGEEEEIDLEICTEDTERKQEQHLDLSCSAGWSTGELNLPIAGWSWSGSPGLALDWQSRYPHSSS